MKSALLKEQARYTRAELIDLLGLSSENAANVIRKLREFGVVKIASASDAGREMMQSLDDDIANVDTAAEVNPHYVVTFVGVVVVAGCVLQCFPKYLEMDGAQRSEKLTEILKVLEKYKAREQVVRVFNDTNTECLFNILAVMQFLLRDYHENGAYEKSQEVIESNGSGEISWGRTINDTIALLIHGRPHYVDLRTKRRLGDERHFVRRLHESVLTQLSRELNKAGLLVLLDIEGVELSDEAPDALGDADYLLYRIDSELRNQFNTRKQLVLKALRAYITERVTLSDIDGFSAFGTNCFNLVWQDVCTSVFGSRLNTPLSALSLPIPLKSEYHGLTLQCLIDKPEWSGKDEAGYFSHTSGKTLIPDLADIREMGGKHKLVIFDAKYYSIELRRDKSLFGQPGIGDVTKQYLYQLAFQKFIACHNISDVSNCFLMPSDDGKIDNLGEVSLEMFSRLGFQPIRITLLPARKLYELYLQGKRIDISRLAI